MEQGEFKIFKMILPLSLPIMATVGLFVGIGYWNDWTNGLYYVTDAKLYSLQNLLNRILQDVQFCQLWFMTNAGVSATDAKELLWGSKGMAISEKGILPIMVLIRWKYWIPELL